MNGTGIIEAFKTYLDIKTSLTAPGYEDDEVLLFLNNAQDQFISQRLFGKNFQPPAFEDNPKRVADILPLVRRQGLASALISAATTYGSGAYLIDKSTLYNGRVLYNIELDVRVTRSNPVSVDEFYRCERIKHESIGRFIQSKANKTHFLYPKITEDKDYYYVICDSHTTLVDYARGVFIVRPYPITATGLEYDGTYGATHMSLRPETHQEIVDIATTDALQILGDPRWQSKLSNEQLQTN
ncbi:MAG: hypothetical protein HC876_22065 [Chloroflexaceae bacterium]|nr:hypothetical protein [Chloroflexaceae bacterium]